MAKKSVSFFPIFKHQQITHQYQTKMKQNR